MPLYPNIIENIKGNSNTFIETGTYLGGGIETAKRVGFRDIYSIEFSDFYYNKCKEKYQTDREIKLYKGDSSMLLRQILKNINHQCVFFLDAHYCGDDTTGLSNVWIPIKNELESIKNHSIKNHIIIIDDLSVMDNSHFDLKTQKWAGAPGLDVVLDLLININPNYNIQALVNENQIIAIENNNINIAEYSDNLEGEKCKKTILNKLFDTRLKEKQKIIKSLCKKLDTLNILYNDIDIDINSKNLNYLEKIKMLLSNKMCEGLTDIILEE